MTQANAQDCINDVVNKMKSTQQFGTAGKEVIFTIYSEEDLFDKAKLVKYPAVGIIYEGTRENNSDRSGQGLGATCNIGLVLLLNGKSVGGIDQKNEAAILLDTMRKTFREQNGKSPTGHAWKFTSELSMGQINGLLVYIQRWQTMIIMN